MIATEITCQHLGKESSRLAQNLGNPRVNLRRDSTFLFRPSKVGSESGSPTNRVGLPGATSNPNLTGYSGRQRQQPPPAVPPSVPGANGSAPRDWWQDAICRIMTAWSGSSGYNSIRVERHEGGTWFIHRVMRCEKHVNGQWVRASELARSIPRSEFDAMPTRLHVEERVISYEKARAFANTNRERAGMEHRLRLLEWSPASEIRPTPSAACQAHVVYHSIASADKHDGIAPAVIKLDNERN